MNYLKFIICFSCFLLGMLNATAFYFAVQAGQQTIELSGGTINSWLLFKRYSVQLVLGVVFIATIYLLLKESKLGYYVYLAALIWEIIYYSFNSFSKQDNWRYIIGIDVLFIILIGLLLSRKARKLYKISI